MAWFDPGWVTEGAIPRLAVAACKTMPARKKPPPKVLRMTGGGGQAGQRCRYISAVLEARRASPHHRTLAHSPTCHCWPGLWGLVVVGLQMS
jgi:hypothetical protein